ncbi:preprotein translocase subunit YajC [Kineococcus rhizosphaerae]|uniref:Preprotein translocase subunit YajC n=1 Tax=Kineococcus rhizosphaerae TaxID=559628 RepID=A0A2T0R9P6_9ACTN|nr:preprotein translocase subunit YajC [Kineococcus rhizosphaerae]PRY17874.1 preprotein translocase subunit YajC [Kineococcus rhizosphaerae]
MFGGSNVILLVAMAALLVFMFSRTRKQQRAQQEMRNGIAPGARVMTTSGLFGTVVETSPEEIVLEIAPGLQTRWTPRAVARVVTPVTAADAVPDSPEGLDLTKRDQDTPGDDAAGGAARS